MMCVIHMKKSYIVIVIVIVMVMVIAFTFIVCSCLYSYNKKIMNFIFEWQKQYHTCECNIE